MKQGELKAGGLKSLSARILIVVISMFVLVVALCVFVTQYQNSSFSDGLLYDQVDRAFANLNRYIESITQDCVKGANFYSDNFDLIRAIERSDFINASEIIGDYQNTGFDFIAITNINGNSIYSSTEEIPLGSNISKSLDALQKALAGEPTSGLYQNDELGIFCTAAVPTYNTDNVIVGAIITITQLSKTNLFDELKSNHGLEFTLYQGDTRYVTTIEQDGQRAVGTELDTGMAAAVFSNKQEFSGATNILGIPHLAKYAPLHDNNGEAIGMLAAAMPLTDIENSRNQTLIMSVSVSAAVVLVAVLSILLFVSRNIRKPLLSIAEKAKKISSGETDITLNYRRKDEIGVLAASFDRMMQSIKALTADTGVLTQAALDGNLSARADAQRHQGGFRKIIEGINNTLDAVTLPIGEAAEVLKEMANGNLDVTLVNDYKGDHAIIKNALNQTIHSIRNYIAEISDLLSCISEGNLNVGITTDYKGSFVALKDSINNIAESLSGVLSEINNASEQVASGTRQVSDGSQNISQGAAQQAASIQELTASILQIAEAAKMNADYADKANQLVMEAKRRAASGDEQMQSMQKAMEEINETSASISKIIKVIDDIAFQTNILALNAAVEAARAGVHGKGFAVVAEEVRNLAARSAQAAKETTVLIEASVSKTEAGTKIAGETAAYLSDIVAGVEKAAALVGEIAVSSIEQATGIAQINQGVDQMSAVVQTNSATSQQSAAAAEQLYSQAETLKTMVGRFRLRTDRDDERALKELVAQNEPLALSGFEIFGCCRADIS